MKPEDLTSPFPWNERRILIKDQVWYVPSYLPRGDSFVFPGWEHPAIFGNKHPINIEYCSGNGAWIAAKASENPETNWIAVEKKFMRVRKIWSKAKNLNLKNLFIIAGEGFHATKNYFPASSIKNVFINFPDPWPKARHVKHRLIQPEFIREMHRIMQPDGKVMFVTDDPAYSEWTIQTFSKTTGFSPSHLPSCFVTEWPGYGNSYFEDLWREKGKIIRYHEFNKRQSYNENHP